MLNGYNTACLRPFTVTLRYKSANCIVSVKLEKTAKYAPFMKPNIFPINLDKFSYLYQPDGKRKRDCNSDRRRWIDGTDGSRLYCSITCDYIRR